MELTDVRCLAVLGLRRSGRPAALLARRSCRRRASSPSTRARRRTTTRSRCSRPPASRSSPARRRCCPDDADLLVKSPGVPDTSAAVQEALRRGVPLWSEVEFACRFLPNPVVGITGTNGKTTTTELTGAIFRDAGLPVAVGGNVGHALAAMPGEVAADATVVAELSSFQLEHIERFRPAVAVLLNLTEDHLDRHGTYRAYVDAKLRIFENQDAGRRGAPLRRRRRDPRRAGRGASRRRAPDAAGSRRVPGRTEGPGGEELLAGVGSDDVLWLHVHGELRRLCRRDELALRGDHNLLNSLAAAAAACAAGAPVSAAAVTPAHLRGCAASPAGGQRGRRRELRQRLQGDQRRRHAQGAHGLLGRRAPHPRRLRQGRRVRRARRRHRGPREAGAAHRRDGAAARGGVRGPRGRARGAADAVRGAAATSRPRCAARPPRPSRATSSCSARPAPAGTSTGTTSSGANTS